MQQPQPSREEAAHQRRESDRRRRELLFAERKERDALRFQHLREKPVTESAPACESESTDLTSSSASAAVSAISSLDEKATAAFASDSDAALKQACIPVDDGIDGRATGVSLPPKESIGVLKIAPQSSATGQMSQKSSGTKSASRKAERKLRASASAKSAPLTLEDGAVCDTCGGWIEDRQADDSVDGDGGWNEYRSACKVLLVGLGADEQLGGYGRHRVVHNSAYNAAMMQSQGAADNNGSSSSSDVSASSASANSAAAAAAEIALRTELLKDTARLWRRNLGRDDRCVSDHGREARHPYVFSMACLVHSNSICLGQKIPLPILITGQFLFFFAGAGFWTSAWSRCCGICPRI